MPQYGFESMVIVLYSYCKRIEQQALFAAKTIYSYLLHLFTFRPLSLAQIISSQKFIVNIITFLNSTCKSDSGLRAFSTSYRPPRGSDKIRASSGPSILPRPEDVISNEPEVFVYPSNFIDTPIHYIITWWAHIYLISISCSQRNRSNRVQIPRLYRIHCRCQNMVDISRN